MNVIIVLVVISYDRIGNGDTVGVAEALGDPADGILQRVYILLTVPLVALPLEEHDHEAEDHGRQ